MTLKGYTIEDTGDKIIIFPSLTTVKNKIIEEIKQVKDEVKVNSFTDLVKLNSINIVKCYRHKENNSELSELQYLDLEKELLSKKVYNEDEYASHWLNLDDEFNYRKFVASYIKENNIVYQEEEIIVIEDLKVVLDTKHPFIKTKFQSVGELSNICIYSKTLAYHRILEEKMQEIGANFLGDSGFADKTEGKLAWSNATHSGIRYAKFAGDYLFNDSFEVKHNPLGKLDYLKAEYEQDKEKIRKIIQDKYLLKFGKFNEEKTPLILEVIKKLETSLRSLGAIIPTRKTESDKTFALKCVRQAKELLNSSFNC